jgi:hypothetical protein
MVRAYNFDLSCNVAKVSRARIYPFDREAVDGEDIGFRNPGASIFHKVRQKFNDVCWLAISRGTFSSGEQRSFSSDCIAFKKMGSVEKLTPLKINLKNMIIPLLSGPPVVS